MPVEFIATYKLFSTGRLFRLSGVIEYRGQPIFMVSYRRDKSRVVLY